MPLQTLAGSNLHYYLLLFDELGVERPERDGTLPSKAVTDLLLRRDNPVTDVFILSHGWMGDVPAAIAQYDSWVGTMAKVSADLDRAQRERPGFTPLVVGLHWPSLPWGDEAFEPASAVPKAGLLSAADSLEPHVDAYAKRISTSANARAAIQLILEAARSNPDVTVLPAGVTVAYQTLFAEAGLSTGDATGRPGADQDGFDPQAIVADALRDSPEAGTGGNAGLLGLGSVLEGAILMPLRQLSFWKMKDRARAFGETGGHALLGGWQIAAPGVRFHLMGHSFGSIVVSAAVAGAPGGLALPRKVDSLFLVQGALSLWSYASDIPYAAQKPAAGYFERIIRSKLVSGPIVTTRSAFDKAVGRFYPLGALLRDQYLLDAREFPLYGGIGAYGIQGRADVIDIPIQSATFNYGLAAGHIYNVDATTVIKHGDSPAGAHSDIAHPEVAHLFWSAALTRAAGAKPDLLSPLDNGERGERSGGSGDELFFEAGPMRGLLGPGIDALLERGPAGRDLDASSAHLVPESASPPAAAAPPPAPVAGAPAPAAAASSESEDDTRFLTAEIEGRSPNEPLVARESYKLVFDIDCKTRPRTLGIGEIRAKTLFPPGADAVTLTLQLDSDDFEIDVPTRMLVLPRERVCSAPAEFTITPKANGSSMIKATLHKDGNFVTRLYLVFDVGASKPSMPTLTTVGREPSAAPLLHGRDLSISLEPARHGIGYDCTIWGLVHGHAQLSVSPELLTSAIGTVRAALMQVIMTQDAALNLVFQSGFEIPPMYCDAALRPLAKAGRRLFQQLFYGPGATADSLTVGQFIEALSKDRDAQLKVQIVAKETPIPWGLMYLGDASDGAQLDWYNFLGMRHIIEQIPFQSGLKVYDPRIRSDNPTLGVSLNLNETIDTQMRSNFVGEQKTFWSAVASSREPINVIRRTTASDVLNALRDPKVADKIMYFYCHAQTTGLTAAGGADSSALVLSDKALMLGDLYLEAPTATTMGGQPLVFINACESAALSGTFYDGFVPYFMAKGARGVVGTECRTPAAFATAWARRFFEKFIDGEPLGQTFLDLRREFLDEHHNPLGLCYAVYCAGDTQVEPALGTVLQQRAPTVASAPTVP
jgi:hypothetical protein